MALNKQAATDAKAAIDAITPFDVESISKARELALVALKSGGATAFDAVEFNEELCNPWDEKFSEAVAAATDFVNTYRRQISEGKAYLQTGQAAMANAVAEGSSSGYLERMDNEVIPFFETHLAAMMELGTVCAENLSEAASKAKSYNSENVEDIWLIVGLERWNEVLELMTQRIDLAKQALQIQRSGMADAARLQSTASSSNSSSSSGGCYVATAVYGSYDCPQVWTLRRFRDFDLAETRRGRAFIKAYYAISPTLVKWFGETDWFKKMWRKNLDLLVSWCQKMGHADTPYEDRSW